METTMSLKFELEDVDGSHMSDFIVDDCESWHMLVVKFTDFLVARYGYPMSDNVIFVTDHPFGRIEEQYITPKELEMVLRNRERHKALDSLFEDTDQ